jgi:hypothetical protein
MKPIPPHIPEARDEGPRLLSLPDEDEKKYYAEKLNHYMRLADLALSRPTEEETDRRRTTGAGNGQKLDPLVSRHAPRAQHPLTGPEGEALHRASTPLRNTECTVSYMGGGPVRSYFDTFNWPLDPEPPWTASSGSFF